MALIVGELVATIDIDDDGARQGMRRAEREVRAGADRIVDIGEQAGEDAGTGLGDGLADGAESGTETTLGKLSGALKGFAAGAIGSAIDSALMGGIGEALEQEKIAGKLGAQLGATPEQAKKYGQIAGQLYAHGITDDFQAAADTIASTMGSGLLPPDATNAQIESISTKVSDLATTFDQDLGGVTNAVSQLLRTGLAKNADEAFDIVAQGFTTSANKADDLLETFNEYSTQFRRIGLDGKTAVGIIDQAIKNGAKDSDQVADAIGQFGELALAGGTAVDQAFKSIGLNADTIRDKLKRGGKDGVEALQMTTDALRKQKDKTKELNAQTALFGDPGTVMGDALLAIDPAAAAASSGMDKAKGATDRLGDGLRDNATTKIETFKRGLQQGLVDFLGGTVLPAVEGFADKFGKVFGGIWAEAAKGGGDRADQILGVFKEIGRRLGPKIAELVPQAISALTSFGQRVADYITQNPVKVLKIAAIATALIAAIGALPVLVAAALSSAAALIMIGFAKKLATFLLENLPEWWHAFTGWISDKAGEAATALAVLGIAVGRWFGSLWSRYISGPISRVWASFITGVRGLPGRAVAALATLGTRLYTVGRDAMTRFKDAQIAVALRAVEWVRGLPGRISRGIGSLGHLLYGKGQSIVTGLWAGIRSMGGWLRDTLISWARSVIPGPIADALGINSPSRVLADQVGRWIPAGVVQGIEAEQGAVDRAMRNLVDVPTPGAAQARRIASTTAGAASSSSATAGPRLVIDVTGADGDFKRLIRRMVRIDGRGSVQHAFGT